MQIAFDIYIITCIGYKTTGLKVNILILAVIGFISIYCFYVAEKDSISNNYLLYSDPFTEKQTKRNNSSFILYNVIYFNGIGLALIYQKRSHRNRI